jgi:hypothetical protein
MADARGLELPVIEVEELPDAAERRRERDTTRHARWREEKRLYVQAYDRWRYRQKHVRYCPGCDIEITGKKLIRCTNCAVERDRALARARYQARKKNHG